MTAISEIMTFCRIAAGSMDGRAVEAFELAKNPVTNEVYGAHVLPFLQAEIPCTLLSNPALTPDHSCSIIARGRNVEDLLGGSLRDAFKDQDPSQPQVHEAGIVFI